MPDYTRRSKILHVNQLGMYKKAIELDGLVSGEHGIGFVKRKYFHQQVGEEQMMLMRGIKAVFDPRNILNPGKIV